MDRLARILRHRAAQDPAFAGVRINSISTHMAANAGPTDRELIVALPTTGPPVRVSFVVNSLNVGGAVPPPVALKTPSKN